MAILKSMHTMDNRQFIKGLSDSQFRSRKAGRAIGRHARQMGRRFQSLTGNVFSLRSAVGLLAGSAGIGLLVSQQMKQIQSTQRVAEVSGFASSTIEALMLQSSKYGIAQERVNDALIDFSERIGEARTGTGEAVDAIERLEELSGRQIDITQEASKVWAEYVGALNQVDDASDRASIAAQIGGDALRDIIPVINEGEQAFRDASEQTRAIGLAFDDIDAAKVDAANDAIANMKASFSGLSRIVTIELAEPIEAVAESMNSALTGSADFQDAVREMTRSAVGAIANVLDASAGVIGFMQRNATMVQFGLVGMLLFGKKGAAIGAVLGGLFSGIKRELAKMGVGSDETTAQILKLEDALDRAESSLAAYEKGTTSYADEAAKKAQKEIDGINRRLAELREQASPDFLEEFNKQWGEGSDAINDMESGLRSLADTLRESLAGESLEPLDLSLTLDRPDIESGGAARLTEEEMKKQKKRLDVIRESLSSEMELEKAHFEREQEFLATAHETLFESEAERKLMLENLEREHQNRLFQIQTKGMGSLFSQQMQFLDQLEAAQKSSGAVQVGIMTNAFATITAAGAQHSRKMFELNKAAGIANAVVSTMVAYTRALAEVPYPFNLVAAASVVAAGMAKVQAIRSQSFQGGGGAAPSTSAGGGVPAVQDVSNQGQQEQAGTRQNVTVQFVGSRTSARDARALLEELRDAAGDDATLGDITFQGA